MLLWSGARCCTRTKAIPGSTSAGMPEKKASKAASPPAEAPMPTMGKPFSGSNSKGRTGFRPWLFGLLRTSFFFSLASPFFVLEPVRDPLDYSSVPRIWATFPTWNIQVGNGDSSLRSFVNFSACPFTPTVIPGFLSGIRNHTSQDWIPAAKSIRKPVLKARIVVFLQSVDIPCWILDIPLTPSFLTFFFPPLNLFTGRRSRPLAPLSGQ